MDVAPACVVRYIQLGLSQEEYEDAGRGVSALLSTSQLTLQQLVVHLGEALTSTQDSIRFRGMQLLGEVLSNVPQERFTAAELHHLAEFLGGRLGDFPTLRCALQASVALTTRFLSSPGPILAKDDALVLAKSFAENLHLPSLSQQDRHLGFTLLSALANGWGPYLAEEGGVDLMECAIASIDGEKDPRCLLKAFELVPHIGRIYAPGSKGEALIGPEAYDELLDVLACYFPVSFNPPPNDPYAITREALARALQAALVSVPQIIPQLTPIVIEKLGATLKHAKTDSLDLLSALARGPGAPSLSPLFVDLWPALRAELLSPGTPGLTEDDRRERRAIAVRAQNCLSALLAALPELVSSVLEDPRMLDGAHIIAGEGAYAHDAHDRLLEQSRAWAGVVRSLLHTASASVVTAALERPLARVVDVARAAWQSLPGAEPSLHRCTEALRESLEGLPTAAAGPWEAALPSLFDAVLGPSGTSATPSSIRSADLINSQAMALQHLCEIIGSLVRDAGAPSSTVLEAAKRAFKHMLALATAQVNHAEQHDDAMDVDDETPSAAPAVDPVDEATTAGVRALIASGRPLAAEVLKALVRPLLNRLLNGTASPLGMMLVEAAASVEGPGGALVREEFLTSLVVLLEDGTEKAWRTAEALIPAVTASVLPASGSPCTDSVDAVAQLAKAVLSGAESLRCAWSLPSAAGLAAACLQRLLPAKHQLPALDRAVRVLTREYERATTPGSNEEARPQLAALCSVALSFGHPEALSVVGAFEKPVVFGALSIALDNASTVEVVRACSVFVASYLAKRAPLASEDALWPEVCSEVEGSIAQSKARISSDSAALGTLCNALVTASSLARSEALKAHPAPNRPLEALLNVASDPALNAALLQAGGEAMMEAQAAGKAMAVAADSLGASLLDLPALGLTKEAFCQPRLLWKQRHCTQILAAVRARMTAQAADAPGLLLAAVGVLSAGPVAVLQQEGPQWVPTLVRAVSLLCSAGWADGPSAHAALLALASLLLEAKGREAAEKALVSVVGALIEGSACGKSAAARKTALRGLVALAELPYSTIFPHKARVLRAVTQALDDPKRAVRQQAVQCRQVWSSS